MKDIKYLFVLSGLTCTNVVWADNKEIPRVYNARAKDYETSYVTVRCQQLGSKIDCLITSALVYKEEDNKCELYVDVWESTFTQVDKNTWAATDFGVCAYNTKTLWKDKYWWNYSEEQHDLPNPPKECKTIYIPDHKRYDFISNSELRQTQPNQCSSWK